MPTSNTQVTGLSVRGGSRVDKVGMSYSNGTTIHKGGSGGTEKTLQLAADEYVTELELNKGTHNGSQRIFFIEFRTNKGRSLSTGTRTSDRITFTAPAGWHVTGLFGRAGTEVDKLGVIYEPQ